ncbi:uroporphyrinogen decarboxylase family protein [Kiritimatiella glycovorans]|uniref:Methyltransferase n=1 Tax=Kiritimatiella glycovorans TaxID=1307763 RepID=A0A0G3EGG3_9BACT|nr:uroporphyrinogen decarboxylase family protein [Kiritimatiella glycovorans]AKJ63875.1 methyltransferase [Kiritimatiella glycovorans]
MDRRRCVQDALNHRTPEKLPVDFGATAVTGIHVSVVAALREHFGLDRHPVRVTEPYQMLGEIEPDLMDVLDVDVVPAAPSGTMFGFPAGNWKEWRTPWGQDVLVPGDFNTTTEPNGDILIYPEGDTSAPPCAKMANAAFFFDTIIRQEEIDDDRLNPEDNLQEFAPVGEEDLEYWRGEIDRAAATGRSVIANFGGTAFGDIALVPGPMLKHPKGIRDIEEWYMSLVIRRDYVHEIFQKQCDIAIGNLEKLAPVAGDKVDAVFICGTDFGTQKGQFCSREDYRELWLPYYKRVNDWIHEHTPWKTFKHSCGAVDPLIPDLIESGFDILNPVQCSAEGMDPQHLKDSYGDQMTFWGGGVDTQHTLPFGSPEDVRRQVAERCRIFGQQGGFVFNTIHNVQARTPVENLVAMLDAVREYNRPSA